MEIANPTKRYDSSHSLVYSCQDHVVFCPKFRRPIRVGEIEERLKELLLAGQQRDEYEWLEWEVMPDHVHLLLSVVEQKPRSACDRGLEGVEHVQKRSWHGGESRSTSEAKVGTEQGDPGPGVVRVQAAVGLQDGVERRRAESGGAAIHLANMSEVWAHRQSESTDAGALLLCEVQTCGSCG